MVRAARHALLRFVRCAMTPEGKVKDVVKKRLVEAGAYFFMPRGTVYGRRGVPDVVGCINGRFFAIEVKAGKNKPTKLQQLEHDAIRAVGGVALVVNEANIDMFIDELRELTV